MYNAVPQYLRVPACGAPRDMAHGTEALVHDGTVAPRPDLRATSSGRVIT